MADDTVAAQPPPVEAEKNELHTVASTLADPQYKAGRKLIDDGRLEEAVNFFSGLLETRVAVLNGDEMSPALAPLYYEYGNSLLYNAEESGAVFGDAITDAEKQRAMAIVEAQVSGADAENQENEGRGPESGGAGGASATPGDGAAPSPDQEAEEDLEIAWENLELARRIYSELALTEEIRTAIAKVHLRLGDLNMLNGMYNEAADEFEKCLGHRLALPSPQSRRVADAHVRRAQALFYASTLEGADKDKLVTLSLEQYRLAAAIFEAMMASSKLLSQAPQHISAGKENNNGEGAEQSNGLFKGKGKGTDGGGGDGEEPPPPAIASGSTEELQDVLDAIRETIETMSSGKDMEALAEYKSGAVSTTVGFGGASSSSSGGGGAVGGGSGSGAVGEVTTVGFGASTTSTGFGNAGGGAVNGTGSAAAFPSSGVGASAAANVMVVKRKGRPAPKAVPSGATVAGGGTATATAAAGESGGDDVAKKAKSNE